MPGNRALHNDTSTTEEQRASLDHTAIGKGGATFDYAKKQGRLYKDASNDELIKYGSITKQIDDEVVEVKPNMMTFLDETDDFIKNHIAQE